LLADRGGGDRLVAEQLRVGVLFGDEEDD